jgi:hypothetical protein
MKRLAAVIISIVFIFTACSRHALENKVFNTAKTEWKAAKVAETADNSINNMQELSENDAAPAADEWEPYWAAGAATMITLYVAWAVISKCCQELKKEKTYDIFVKMNPNTELTAQEIFDKLGRWGRWFKLQIDKKDVLYNNLTIPVIYRLCNEVISNRGNRIVCKYPKDHSDSGVLLVIDAKDGKIRPNPSPIKLTRVKTKHIETLKIIPDRPEDTEFFGKLIVPEANQIEKTYNIRATLNEKYEAEVGVKAILDEVEYLGEMKAGTGGMHYIDIDFNLDMTECKLTVIREVELTKFLACVKGSSLVWFYNINRNNLEVEKQKISLGRIKTSKSISELKVRCRHKFVEDLIQIESNE